RGESGFQAEAARLVRRSCIVPLRPLRPNQMYHIPIEFGTVPILRRSRRRLAGSSRGIRRSSGGPSPAYLSNHLPTPPIALSLTGRLDLSGDEKLKRRGRRLLRLNRSQCPRR